MKLQTKRSLSLLLTGILTAGAMMSGCSGGTVSTTPSAPAEESANTTVSEGESTSEEGAMTLPENGGFTSVSYEPSKDKYRTFYEIFPYSFCDSNGDGIGDLKGITSKLDYLNDGDPSTTTDLGIEGIWLMPVMQSPSYHKYNVTDYLSIDKDYGTMDDFKELVSEAHKRNINVIIDLVLNHTSKTHEWYKKAVAELKEGKEDGYAQYYHFSKEQKNSKWSAVGGTKYFYECEFDTDMPDLNLTNEKVREEIQKIVDYWIDAGVDGFRLDAVMWFEESGTEGCVQDLKWLYDYAKSVKDDVYMVGECWTGFSTVRQYYASGVDSFFNFDQQGSDGDVANAIHKHNAKGFVDSLVYYQDQIEKYNPLGINTPFISNHDTGRSAGFLTTETDRRMAASMYIMAPGNPFIYYGEELAMTGSENDPAKRTGMLWSTTDSTGYVEKIPGSSNKEKPKEGVEEAQKNEDSLLNFYKRVVRLKSQNPEIARGKIAAVDLGIKEAGGYVAEYDGSKVMVIFNAGAQGVSVTVPKDDFTVNEVRGYLKADAGDSASGGGKKPSALDSLMGSKAESSAEESAANAITEFTVKGQEIQMPAYSVIVLK